MQWSPSTFTFEKKCWDAGGLLFAICSYFSVSFWRGWILLKFIFEQKQETESHNASQSHPMMSQHPQRPYLSHPTSSPLK